MTANALKKAYGTKAGIFPKLKILVEAHGALFRGLRAAEKKKVFQLAMTAGAEWWVANYLNLRFHRGYAYGKLGYKILKSSEARKKRYGATDPLVWTGDTRVAVLENNRIVAGGSAAKPWVDVRMKLPGPRARIVYEVLSKIIDSEVGAGMAAAMENELNLMMEAAIVTQHFTRGRRKGSIQKSSLAGSVSVTSAEAMKSRDRANDVKLRRKFALFDARDFAADKDIRRAQGMEAGQSALKRTRDKWHRQSGGSAPTYKGGYSKTYLGSQRYRRAQQQREYRRRYRA